MPEESRWKRWSRHRLWLPMGLTALALVLGIASVAGHAWMVRDDLWTTTETGLWRACVIVTRGGETTCWDMPTASDCSQPGRLGACDATDAASLTCAQCDKLNIARAFAMIALIPGTLVILLGLGVLGRAVDKQHRDELQQQHPLNGDARDRPGVHEYQPQDLFNHRYQSMPEPYNSLYHGHHGDSNCSRHTNGQLQQDAVRLNRLQLNQHIHKEDRLSLNDNPNHNHNDSNGGSDNRSHHSGRHPQDQELQASNDRNHIHQPQVLSHHNKNTTREPNLARWKRVAMLASAAAANLWCLAALVWLAYIADANAKLPPGVPQSHVPGWAMFLAMITGLVLLGNGWSVHRVVLLEDGADRPSSMNSASIGTDSVDAGELGRVADSSDLRTSSNQLRYDTMPPVVVTAAV